MKTLIQYLRQYQREAFHAGAFALVILLLGVGVYFNYIEPVLRQTSKSLMRSYWYIAYYVALYGGAFWGTYLIQSIFTRDWKAFRSPTFWFWSIGAILVFSTRAGSHLFMIDIWTWLQSLGVAYYWSYSAHTIFRMSMIVIPVLLYWFMFDRREQPLYGWKLKDVDLKPYLTLLILMVPLIAFASTQADFLKSYPKGAAILHQGASGVEVFIYELVYGLDFVAVEFFIRGFMVLALARLIGPSVILPLAAFYVTIHFGKPMGEAISSFFGGMILGIVAFYSRSILGGIIVHLGIAWMMELGAALGRWWS